MSLSESYTTGQTVGATDINNITAAINDLVSGATLIAGFLRPVKTACVGGESYTVSAGSVTQIAGTTINSVAMSVGDRLLVMGAPSSTGSGTDYNTSSSPANGLYVVTGTSGGNTQVARTEDMSGSVDPRGLTVYTYDGNWTPKAFYTVAFVDGSPFVYGTNMMWWEGTGGRNLNVNGAFFAALTQTIGISNGTGATWIQPTANSGTQTIKLPPDSGTTTMATREWVESNSGNLDGGTATSDFGSLLTIDGGTA